MPFQKPDAVDMHILSILEVNGRATNREIAESVGVSEGTVRNRIERLVRDDVLRIVGVTNPARLGLNTAAVISISAELARITEIAERIAEATGVVYVGYTTGNADIVALAFFPSNDDLTDFMTQTLASIPGILKAETNIILKPVRSLFPGATVNARGALPTTRLTAAGQRLGPNEMIDAIATEPAKRVLTYDHDGNENGWLVELYKDGRLTLAYLTAAKPGAFKGYHLHRVRAARYVCVRGRMRIILYEGRQRQEYILDAADPQRLFIPPNVATGLENIGDEEAWLINYPDPPYDPDLKDEQVEYTQQELEAGVVK